MAKNKIVLGIIATLVLVAGAGLYLTKFKSLDPSTVEGKREKYAIVCEYGETHGLYQNSVEYDVCTDDLGYYISALQSGSNGIKTEAPSNKSANGTSADEEELKEAQKQGCITLRAVSLEDLIKSNQANGISESDTRITYDAGIAQCNSLGY